LSGSVDRIGLSGSVGTVLLTGTVPQAARSVQTASRRRMNFASVTVLLTPENIILPPLHP
jgi:hypothetical protein